MEKGPVILKVAPGASVEYELSSPSPSPATSVESLLASPRSILPRPAGPGPRPPEIPVLAERIPLVAGLWIEPGSDPGHAAHLEPVATLLEHLQREFPATPWRLLVPPRIAEANWLRQLAGKAGCPVSLTTEIDPEAPPVETLVRHSHAVLCLAPGPGHHEDIVHLLKWKREGKLRDSEPVFGGPVEFWDLSRGSRARRQRLEPTLARKEFARFSRNVRAFNLRARHLAPRLEEAVAQRKEELQPENARLPLTRGQEAALERHALNAAIASRFLPMARAAQIAWSLGAPLCAVLLVAAAQTGGEWHRMLLGAGLGLLALTALARFLDRRWLHLAHHHAALGEAMQLHLVRGIAGLPGLRAGEVPHPPGAAPWFRIALDHWLAGLAQTEPQAKCVPERHRHLGQTWLRAEGGRFQLHAAEARQTARCLRKFTLAGWTVTAVTATGLLAAAVRGESGPPGWILAAVTGLGFGIASLSGQRAALLRLESQQAERDARAMNEASERLLGADHAADTAVSARFIQSLTTEALTARAERSHHELNRGFSPPPEFR